MSFSWQGSCCYNRDPSECHGGKEPSRPPREVRLGLGPGGRIFLGLGRARPPAPSRGSGSSARSPSRTAHGLRPDRRGRSEVCVPSQSRAISTATAILASLSPHGRPRLWTKLPSRGRLRCGGGQQHRHVIERAGGSGLRARPHGDRGPPGDFLGTEVFTADGDPGDSGIDKTCISRHPELQQEA